GLLRSNGAGHGGAIYLAGAALNAQHSQFTHNSVSISGNVSLSSNCTTLTACCRAARFMLITKLVVQRCRTVSSIRIQPRSIPECLCKSHLVLLAAWRRCVRNRRIVLDVFLDAVLEQRGKWRCPCCTRHK